MPPRRPARAPVKRVFEPLPKNSFWILNDAYDRRVWHQLRAESPSLRELEEKGAAFLPHFGSLLQDIFCDHILKSQKYMQHPRGVYIAQGFAASFLLFFTGLLI